MPEPDPKPEDAGILYDLAEHLQAAFVNAFGDMTIGELIDSVKDVRINDAIKNTAVRDIIEGWGA